MQIGCKEIIHAVRIGQLYDKESRMLDLEKLEGLVKIMEGSTLNTMSIKDGDFKIMMSKLDNPPIVAGSGVVSSISAVSSDSSASNSSTDNTEEENEVHITSPIVGTFYSAKGPTIPAFVKVGDTVKAGDTVCILEAMKMMNEITADFDCEIEAVLVSNEQKVEYGQPLFRVRKL